MIHTNRIVDRLRALIFALPLAAAIAPGAAAAQMSYPDRALRLIVPYPPGGLTDSSARLIAKGLASRLGQNVVVENIGGGGGNIGAEKAARSSADGYTLYVGNNATVGLNTLMYRSLAFDPLKDLAPVAQYAESHTVLVVHPSVPAKTVGELVALAKRKPGELNFGSTGQGGLSHLVGELFNATTAVRTVHVPYKGTGPALTDLLGGQIQMMFNDTSLPHIKAGKLRALAVTGERRWDDLPEVPTFSELGIRGYETYNWFGIFVPSQTPAEIVARLNREIIAVVGDPETREWLRSRGAVGRSGSVDDFRRFIEADLAKWTRLVREVGIQPE